MPEKLYPLPESGVVVEDDKIYHNRKLVAELRYLGSSKDGQRHEGIAIFYYQYNKEVWIYPKEGFHIFIVDENKKYSTIPEIKEWLITKAKERGYVIAIGNGYMFDPKKVRYTRGDRDEREFKPMPSAFDVKISQDGRYIRYKTSGIFFDSSHKYFVEHGISK
jgi:hypothetical protein